MAELVTLAEAKAMLQSPDGDDGLVTDLIRRASAAVESYTGRRFLHTDLTELHDGGSKALIVRFRPVVQVQRVVDTATGQEVPPDEYVVGYGAGLVLRRCGRWAEGPLRWQVEYTAGYAATVEGVPGDVKQAVLQLVAAWYNRRDAGVRAERIGDYSRDAETGLPAQVRELLEPYVEVVV
ncbi:MAG: phage head-tail connector protein [Symbiobacteriaceae bacterium]